MDGTNIFEAVMCEGVHALSGDGCIHAVEDMGMVLQPPPPQQQRWPPMEPQQCILWAAEMMGMGSGSGDGGRLIVPWVESGGCEQNQGVVVVAMM